MALRFSVGHEPPVNRTNECVEKVNDLMVRLVKVGTNPGERQVAKQTGTESIVMLELVSLIDYDLSLICTTVKLIIV